MNADRAGSVGPITACSVCAHCSECAWSGQLMMFSINLAWRDVVRRPTLFAGAPEWN
jgi:hypothetical protein